MLDSKEIKIITGGLFSDDRGQLSFINDFDLSQTRRMYMIEPANTSLVRAWQGHKKEEKYFLVLQGSFTIGLVQVDNWSDPSSKLKPTFIELDANNPRVLCVPGGYANGIKANTAGSKLAVFSSRTLEEAKGDEFRFDIDKWHFE